MMALFVITLRVICHCFAGISFTLIITFVPGSKSLCFPPLPEWSRADLGPLESQQALPLHLPPSPEWSRKEQWQCLGHFFIFHLFFFLFTLFNPLVNFWSQTKEPLMRNLSDLGSISPCGFVVSADCKLSEFKKLNPNSASQVWLTPS